MQAHTKDAEDTRQVDKICMYIHNYNTLTHTHTHTHTQHIQRHKQRMFTYSKTLSTDTNNRTHTHTHTHTHSNKEQGRSVLTFTIQTGNLSGQGCKRNGTYLCKTIKTIY